MAQRHDTTVAVRAQLHRLDRFGPVAVRGEHLRTGQLQLHRPPDHARGHRREGGRRPAIALAAEAAAHIRVDHPHVRLRQAEHPGQRLVRPADALGRVPHRQMVAVPACDCGVRLHRVVVLDRGRVGRLDAHLRRRQRPVRVAAAAVRRAGSETEFLRHVRLIERIVHPRHERRRLIRHAHARRRCLRLFQRLGHDDRDMLTVVGDAGVLQHRAGHRLHLRRHAMQAQRVIRRDDRKHTGHRPRLCGVDPRDGAGADRALHQRGVRHAGLVELGGILRGARNLGAPVAAVDRQADDVHDPALLRPARPMRAPSRAAPARP